MLSPYSGVGPARGTIRCPPIRTPARIANNRFDIVQSFSDGLVDCAAAVHGASFVQLFNSDFGISCFKWQRMSTGPTIAVAGI